MVIRSSNGHDARTALPIIYEEDINYFQLHNTPGGVALSVIIPNDFGDEWELMIELTHTDLLVIKEMIKKGLI